MLELWYAAANTPLGLVVRTDNRDKLKMRLYAARAKAHDPTLDAISIVCPASEPDRLWLIRKEPADE
jgi:hypothetical protein